MPVAERILPDKYRKRFSESYYRIAHREDLMGWIWTTKFGWDVVNCVCTAIGKTPPDSLLNYLSILETAPWNAGPSEFLNPDFVTAHPFDISVESALPSSFFTKTYIANADNTLYLEDVSVRQIARGTISKSKKKNLS